MLDCGVPVCSDPSSESMKSYYTPSPRELLFMTLRRRGRLVLDLTRTRLYLDCTIPYTYRASARGGNGTRQATVCTQSRAVRRLTQTEPPRPRGLVVAPRAAQGAPACEELSALPLRSGVAIEKHAKGGGAQLIVQSMLKHDLRLNCTIHLLPPDASYMRTRARGGAA